MTVNTRPHWQWPLDIVIELYLKKISRVSCKKGPICHAHDLPCVRMAGRALLAGYHHLLILRWFPHLYMKSCPIYTGTKMCMCPTNERMHYSVTPSLIGWEHTQNGPCIPHTTEEILHSNFSTNMYVVFTIPNEKVNINIEIFIKVKFKYSHCVDSVRNPYTLHVTISSDFHSDIRCFIKIWCHLNVKENMRKWLAMSPMHCGWKPVNDSHGRWPAKHWSLHLHRHCGYENNINAIVETLLMKYKPWLSARKIKCPSRDDGTKAPIEWLGPVLRQVAMYLCHL